MYARVLKFENADSSRRDEARTRIREQVIPMLETIDGFGGYIGLFNEEENRATAIVLWESKEAAETAEQQLAPRREQMISEMGMTISSNKVLEAPVVEVRTGVTA